MVKLIFGPFPIVSQQGICQDKQLSHDGRDRDFLLFPRSDQGSVFLPHIQIEPDGDKCRHEYRMAQVGTPAQNPSLALPFPRAL